LPLTRNVAGGFTWLPESVERTDPLAPECECRVSATFRGRVEGKRIDGTFRTADLNGGERTGQWRHADADFTRSSRHDERQHP